MLCENWDQIFHSKGLKQLNHVVEKPKTNDNNCKMFIQSELTIEIFCNKER